MSTENKTEGQEEGATETSPGMNSLEFSIRSKILGDIIRALNAIVDEAKLNISEDGITVKTVDPAHVCMVDMTLQPSIFDELIFDNAGEIGIDVDKIKSILKLASKKKKDCDIIRFSLDAARHRLKYSVGCNNGIISMIDTTGMSDPKPPKLNLPSSFVIEVVDVVNFIKRAQEVSDHISIETYKKDGQRGVIFRAENDTDSAELVMPYDLLVDMDDAGEASKSRFSLTYFANIMKAVKGAAETIAMHIGTNYPFQLDYDLDNGNGHVTVLLAPRIENE